MKNHFGAALGRFLTSTGFSYRGAAPILEQFHTVISTVVAGTTPMSSKNLATILGNIRRHHRKFGLTATEGRDAAIRLHAAWLEDFILPEYAGLMGVVSRTEPVPPPTDPRAAALSYFDEASQRSAEVADWLIATRTLMGDGPATPRRRPKK